MTTKGREILDGLEALKNDKWVNEYKCYYGYYPVEYLDSILKKAYENDFENDSEMMKFINERVWHNMVDKGIIKLSKAGSSFKILV